MSRTYKSTGFVDQYDDGEKFYQKPQHNSDRHSKNVCKWVRSNILWPFDLAESRMWIKHTNRTKNKWYEMCYNEAVGWEHEHLDDVAMDKEWTRMQDELAADNSDVRCGCGWAGSVDELEPGFVIMDEEHGRTVCHCPRCGDYNDYIMTE